MLYAEVIYVKQLISRCPGCQGALRISTLQCPDCGMELKNDFELSKFDQLDSEQYKFLLSFLKGRGSLKEPIYRCRIPRPKRNWTSCLPH